MENLKLYRTYQKVFINIQNKIRESECIEISTGKNGKEYLVIIDRPLVDRFEIEYTKLFMDGYSHTYQFIFPKNHKMPATMTITEDQSYDNFWDTTYDYKNYNVHTKTIHLVFETIVKHYKIYPYAVS